MTNWMLMEMMQRLVILRQDCSERASGTGLTTQALLEIYAAIALATRYNDFDTHWSAPTPSLMEKAHVLTQGQREAQELRLSVR
jgi:hypothetical protein